MIKLENQITLQFSLGPFTDFIGIDDLSIMEIKENAGGLRPILNMSFTLDNEDIIPYLNQGSIITLMYGINEPTSDVLQFEIQGDSKTKQYSLGSQIDILGALYNPAFTNTARKKTYNNKKSFEVFKEIATLDNMKLVTNVTKTNDKQTWYQSGRKDWPMLQHVWERSYKDPNTFFSYGFDCNNIYFYDIVEQVKQGPRWLLSVPEVGNSDKSKIVNIGTYQVDESQVGPLSQMVGKNETTIAYNVDTGEFSQPKHNIKTLTTMNTNKVNINATGCENYNFMITSGDDHANALSAVKQNMKNNLLFSSYTVYVPIPGQYRDFRLLDLVQLIPAETDEDAAGLYFITGITRQYHDNLYQTNLVLNRESGNGIKGDSLQGGN